MYRIQKRQGNFSLGSLKYDTKYNGRKYLSIDYFNKNVSCKTPHRKTTVQHHCFYYLCQNYMVQMHSLCYFNLIQGKTERCGEMYR